MRFKPKNTQNPDVDFGSSKSDAQLASQKLPNIMVELELGCKVRPEPKVPVRNLKILLAARQ